MAKKQTQEKELTLDNILFRCRDGLRGAAPLFEKRDMLLTLVFIKFVSDRFDEQHDAIIEEYKAKGMDDKFISMRLNRPEEYKKAGVFFIEEDCKWQTIVNTEAKDLALTLDNVINKLESSDAKLKGALPQQIFTKNNLEPKVIRSVVDEINKIDPKKFKDKDLIGRVYEYFLQAFAIKAEDEEGEYYTPQSVVELIASLIEPFDGTLYDPCCGSGGMFVQSAKMMEAHGQNKITLNVYGQESEPTTFRLAKMNLAVRGISYHLGDRAVSTFTNDHFKDKKMDYVMANPPFNLKRWREKNELLDDVRWNGYAVPPASFANYAWILHILNKLQPHKGIAGFLMANGALDEDETNTKAIREKLIENDKVEAIIILPRNMFYTVDCSATLWILNENKKGGLWHGRKLRDRSGEILFVDLRTWNENKLSKDDKYKVYFSHEQIEAAKKIFIDWQTIAEPANYAKPELYYSATKEEIKANDYSLIPSLYIEFIDRDSEIEYNNVLSSASATVKDLLTRQTLNQKLLVEAFKTLGYEIK